VTQLVYLGSVLATIGCMAIMDHRWGLFFWADARRALPVWLAGTAFFVTWDTVALSLGYYERGGSPYMTGVELGGVLPLEEVAFCAFLPYITMVLHGLALRWQTPAREPGEPS
jgi:lycopene cyclase domain-containing protein